MKKLWLLVAVLAIVSCQTEKKKEYAVISGKIENANSNKLTIYNLFDLSKKSEITLSEDGTFADTLANRTDFYMLRHDKEITKFYAPKGNYVQIVFDAKKKDSTLQIMGDASVINNYLNEKAKNYKAEMGNMKDVYLKNEEDFKAHLLKIKTAEEDLLFNTNGLPEDFKKNETNNITYNYLSLINIYELYHGYYSKDRSFKVSENFSNEKDSIDLTSENDFLFSEPYRGLVVNHYQEKAQDLMKKDSTLVADLVYLETLGTIESEVIKNKLLYDDAKYGITYTSNLEDYYALYSKFSTDEENNRKITEDYNKLKTLSKGKPSPQFTAYENNAGGTISLEDLKGSFVYIDVWATWCGPCIAEIPSLKKVEKEYHDQNIKFLSVSIDTEDAYDKWKEMIVDKELGGIQLLADNAWESKFITDYMIKGIPRFILLDPQGNIVSSNAPRPSDKKLVELFKELKI